MAGDPNARSFLTKLKICNIGCIGPKGLEVCLDEIVCLVGANNTGKSTVLRAYEAAVTGAALAQEEVSTKANSQPATVELWVHIPEGAGNVDEKWKQSVDGMLLVRSMWTWPAGGGKPVRTTWDPENGAYAEVGNASGLDTVFYSRLPRPLRIGSLDDPTEEHKKLLDLVLEPIKTRLADLMRQDGSELRKKIIALQQEAEKPVAEFKEDLDRVQTRVNKSYRSVFRSAEVRLSVSLGDLAVDPGAALVKSSHVGVFESHGQTRWSQQGTGSQRALFWSMLEVRSELNRISEERKQMEQLALAKEKALKKLEEKLPALTKKSAIDKCQADIAETKEAIAILRPGGGTPPDPAPAPFLPGYMLLIDEPETALHPAAIRAAKEHLYSLASEAGWQVMLSTHHPAFIDPLKDHTTIVRLHRPETNAPPNLYRADSVKFNDTEKETLKKLLAFDQSVAEMFFSSKVIIVEGDTEFAAFTVVMDSDPLAFPIDGRPLLLRARGKWTIPLLVRMLTHFKVPCAVLHDVDAPLQASGKRKNGAYAANREITDAVKAARAAGVHIIHRCSEPDFERKHKMDLPSKDKPFNAWDTTIKNDAVRKSVRAVLDHLCDTPDAESANHADDGQHYESKCMTWAMANAAEDPAFQFD